MLVETFRLIRRSPGLFLVFLIGLCVPVILGDISGSNSEIQGSQLFISLYVLWSVQQMAISGGRAMGINAKGGSTFFLKHFALFVVATAICIIPLFTIGPNTFALAMLIMVVVYPLLLAMMGTWPMSGMQPTEISLATALRIGVKSLGTTYFRILVAFIAPFLVAFASGAPFAAPPAFVVDGRFNAPGALTAVIGEAAQLISLTYIAIVLSRRYLSFTQSTNLPLAATG